MPRRARRVEAAATVPTTSEPAAGGASPLQPFTFPLPTAMGKSTVLSVPSLQRAHDLIVSLVAGLPIVSFRLNWNEETQQHEEERLKPLPWHLNPDPIRTRAAFLGFLASDLWAYGRAYARVTSRYQDTGFPASFIVMPFEHVTVTYPVNAVPELGIVPGCTVQFQSQIIPIRDVVEFMSPLTGVCETAFRAVQTAILLDSASNRFASVEMPSGWLEQVEGEPMSGSELNDLAAAWAQSRKENATGALNQFVKFRESTFDPDRLQLIEARQYQALEMARIGNVPPYLIGAPAGTGMTYQNAQTARADLVDFGAAPLLDCIDQTFSGPAITPRGQFVRLNINAWLAGNPYVSGEAVSSDMKQQDQSETPPDPQDMEEKQDQRQDERQARREERRDTRRQEVRQ